MAMSSLAVERRFRRRRQFAIVLTLIVIIGLIALALRYRTEERQTSEYLVHADEIARSEQSAADSMQSLFNTLGNFDRPAILQRINGLIEDTTTYATDFENGAVVTRPAAEAHGLLTVAVTAWNEGLVLLEPAVNTVMDQPEDAFDVSQLQAALDQLRLGDMAYAAFVESVADIELDIQPPAFPEVRFVADVSANYVEGVARQLRLSRILDERFDISVSASTDPIPAGEQGGVAVMPFEAELSVTAVVTNQGNVNQEQIEVIITLARSDSEEPPITEVRIIPSLEPGTSLSQEFVGLPLVPGALYTVTVTADVTEDADIENNVWELFFATNAE